jgi:uncharacterized membrane protein (UPF0127 family)
MSKHSKKKWMKTKKETAKTEKSFFKHYGRVIILVLLGVGLFFSTMYGYRCLVEKVCESEIINRMVRHDVTILMPKGALVAEVVNTKSSRMLGLSGRSKMLDSEGMLFVFDEPGKYGFWMKDMTFALDIIWINKNGVVVAIERGLTPETYPKTYINGADANYVLEVNAGLSEKFGLYLGSKVKIAE